MTRIHPEEFINEVRGFGISKDTQNKVRMMLRGNLVFLKFHNPMSGEVIETIVTRQDFERTQFMNWGPIAIPATWEIEEDEMIKINKQLEVINGSTITQPPNRDNNPGLRQFSA